MEKENILFNRKEIMMETQLETSPKLQEALTIVSKEFSTPEENIKIKKIKSGFGTKKFIIDANIYKSKEEKESLERKSKKETELEKSKEQAQAQPEEKTDTPKEQPPAETTENKQE